jgi:hypothetical protein
LPWPRLFDAVGLGGGLAVICYGEDGTVWLDPRQVSARGRTSASFSSAEMKDSIEAGSNPALQHNCVRPQ